MAYELTDSLTSLQIFDSFQMGIVTLIKHLICL